MVAVVSGSGLGLFTSNGTSGNSNVGRGRDQVFVNTTTGNLVVQSTDDTLAALGLDFAAVRTYNSQGLTDEDNNDQWRLGVQQRIYNLTGTVNTAGSTITKVFGDGAEVLYTWNATRSRYESTDGDGANDFLTWNGTVWTWTDGSSRATEEYGTVNGVANIWRIKFSRDAESTPNTVTYTYATGTSLLSSIAMAGGTAQTVNFTYATGTSDISSIQVVSNGVTTTLTRYYYDSSHRLRQVVLDLTPADNTVPLPDANADGIYESTANQTYITTYTYEGTSKRIASITQTDGSSVAFTYQNINGDYRLKTVTDAENRVTTFTYNDVLAGGGTPMSTPPINGTYQTTDNVPYSQVPGALTASPAGWNAAGLRESSSTSINDPRIGFDSNGNGWLVWRSASNVIAQRYTRATNSWGPEIILDSSTATASNQSLSVDASGNAVVAWVQNDASGVSSVWGARYDAATATWSAATLIDSTVIDPTFAARTTGNTLFTAINGSNSVVAWQNAQSAGSTTYELYVVRLDATTLYPPELVDAYPATAVQQSVAIDSQGNVMVAYQQSDGTNTNVYVSRYDRAANTWSGNTVARDNITGAASDPRIALDANGNGILIYRTSTDVKALRYTRATNSWGTTQVLDANSTAPTVPVLALDANGTGFAAWVQSDGSAASVYAARFDGTSWGAATLLDTGAGINSTFPANTAANTMQIAVSGNRAAVMWMHNQAATGSVFDAYVARYDGTAWQAAESVEARTENAAQVNVAVDSLGNVSAAFMQSDGTANSTWVARYNVSAASSYYSVPSGATWQSVANAVYGVNSAAAGTQLQSQMAGQTLATRVQLGGFPPTLTVTQTVAPYYVIVSGDSWPIVTQKLYGTSDANAVAALQTFNGGSTTLPAVGQRLNVANPLNYTTGGSGAAVYQRTTVQDALGLVTTYLKDAQGRLISVQTPAVGGSSLETRYTYDSATGNVATITEDPNGLNRVTTFSYDANTGLLLSTRDSLGNTVTRTYDANNQLDSETSYLVRDPDGGGAGQPSSPLVTRYIYDSENHLRFVLSADGRVTEHIYDAPGQRTTTFKYASSTYTSTTYTEAALNTWATNSARRGGALERIDYAYDFRSNLQTVTAWATTDSTGAGTGAASTTRFVYDQRGNLLSTVEARGEATATPTTDYVTSYTYDGLGRVLTTTSWVSATETARLVQTNSYDDANRRTVSTFANGLTKTLNYDKAGSLTSVVNGPAALGTTSYTYDADARLRVTTDPTGVKSYAFYDDAGRLQGTIDGDGSLVEFIYNRANQVVKTVRYATALSSTTLTSLSGGTWSSVAFATLRTEANPAGTQAQNQITRNVYDASGTLVYTVDPIGAVTQKIYDGAGRLTDEVSFFNTQTIAASVDEVLPSAITVTSHAADRRTRYFYNGDGQLLGTLDGAGYLKENVYDAAGRLTTTIGYYTVTNSANWLTGTLATLRPAVDATRDITTRFFYDAQGRMVGSLDGENYLTENVYDVAGNVLQSIRYDRVLTYTVGTSTFATLKSAAAGAATHTTTYTYDGLGEVLTETNFENTQTLYTYDVAGNVIAVSRANGVSAEVRTTRTRYDVLGRVTQELTGEGSVALAALGGSPTQTQIDDVWSKYGVAYTYDNAGRRTSATVRPNDTQTNTTYYYYDNDGRLRFELDARGAVTENRYNALGQLTDKLVYWRTVSIASPTGGLLTPALVTALSATESANVHERTTYGYSLRGELVSTSTVSGASTALAYNVFGELRQSNAGTGFTATDYTYDARGLQKLTQRGGTTFEDRTYDAFGRLATVVDARGNSSTTTYDRLGREVTSIQSGDTNATLIGYDAFSRVLTSRDKLLNTTTYSYNDATKTVTVTTPEGIVVSTAHNSHGDTVSVTANGNTTTYQYDRNGQLTGSSDNLGALEGRTYDRAGRQVTGTDARQVLTTFAYDASNRMISRIVTSPAATGEGLSLTTTYAYDASLRRLDVTEPGNRLTRTEYDRDGRVSAVIINPNGTTPSRTEYTYDGANNVLTMIEGVGSTLPRRVKYVYDALGRRSDEYVDALSLGGTLDLRTQYKYDNNDNVTRKIDAKGNSTWYVYDAQNRLSQTIDALGGVTQLSYDDEDRVVTTRRHYNTVSTGSLGDTPSAQSVAHSPNDQVSRSVYDNDGRERFTLVTSAATGTSGNVTSETAIVTERTFDAAGNVTRTRVYRNAITVPATRTPATIATTLTNAGNSLTVPHADDRVERTLYDVRGRVEVTIDGSGAVTKFEYDASGNVTQKTEYAATVPVDGAMRVWYVPSTNSSASQYLGSFQAGDVVTATVRFKAPSDTSGAMFLGDAGGPNPYDNSVYTLSYGNDGWQTLTLTQTMTHDDDMWVYVYGDRDGAYANSSHSVLYDNLKVVSAQKGTVLTDTFDGTVGNWSQSGLQTADSTTLWDLGSDAAIRSLVNGLASSTQDRVTRFWYDSMDRARFSLDAEGYLVETKYLDSAKQEQTIVYAGKPSIAAGATLANVVSAASGLSTNPANQTTTQTFDVAGHVVQVTDALGKSEYFVYDAVGNKIKYVNKKAASANDAAYTWTFDYDANHRLVYERSPAVSVTTVTENGETLDVATNASLVLVTHNLYDALGNVTSRVEAEGTTQARTTSFEYDLLGRQTATITPTVGVYNEALGDGEWGANGATVARRETSTQIRSETAYDVFGNAFRNRLVKATDASNAALGAYTYKAYDTLGRVKYEIDAKRQVTSYGYDTFGNKLTVTRHANALLGGVTLPSTGNAGLFDSQITPPTSSADRTITTVYDRLNRATSVKQPSASHFIASVGSAGGTTLTVQPTVEYQYNAFGDVVMTRELTGNNSWATSYAGYNQRGLKVWDLDAQRYLTRYFYDDETGDLTSQIEYAVPTTGIANADGYGTIVPSTGAAAAGADRQTNYTYDKLNRKISETKANLEYSYVDGSGVLQNSFTGSQTTTYGYDALGNQTLTRVQDPNGGANVDTYTYYDVLGRVIAIAQPARNRGDGTSLTPFTRMLRDAHGNLAQQIEYFDSLASAPVEGTLPTAPSTNATLNRVTSMLYDGRNNVTATVDPTNAMRKASYDTRGDLAKEWQRVVNPNISSATTDDITDTVVTLYRYDAVGQQTEIQESQRYNGASSVNVTRVAEYNAFGEITAKYNQGAAADQKTYYNYDQLGRVWRTNADDGVDKVYMFDLQGNATVELRSTTADLAASGITSAADALGAANLLRTETAYDLKGNIVERRMPTFTTSNGLPAVGTNLQLTTVNGSAYITWTGTLSAIVNEVFEYRVSGTTGAYAALNIEQVSSGVLGVNVHSYYNQSYEYRIQYKLGTDSNPYAESTGTFRVDRGTNTNYSISRTAPNTANDVQPLSIQQSGPTNLVITGKLSEQWNGFSWQYDNVLSVDLTSLGNGPAQVYIQYTDFDHDNPNSFRVNTTYWINLPTTAGVTELRWRKDPNNDPARQWGGLSMAHPVNIIVYNSQNVVIGQTNAQPGPPMLMWAAPTDQNVTATFKYKLPADSGWSTVQAERFGAFFRVNVTNLLTANSTYNYQVDHVLAGNVVASRGGDLNSSGVVTTRTISGAALGDTALSGVFNENIGTPAVVGTQMAWAAPTQAVSATFEYNQGGGGYTPLTISQGADWRVELGGLSRGVTYGYRITYRIGNRIVAEQTGTFSITTVPSSTNTSLVNTPGSNLPTVPDVGTLAGESNLGGASATMSGSQSWDWFSNQWWMGPNSATLSWADVGNRPVTVYLIYAQINQNGVGDTSRRGSATFSFPNGGSGGGVSWYDNDSDVYGGVLINPPANLQPIVEVWGSDSAGRAVLLRKTGNSGSGATPRLTWSAPSDGTLIPTFTYSGAGVGGASSGTLPVTTAGGVASVNLGLVAGAAITFTVSYTRPGESAPVVSRTGTFTSNGVTSSVTSQGTTSNANAQWVTVGVAGSTLSWTRAASGIPVTFSYRVQGSSTWLTDRQPSTSDNIQYSLNLLGMPSNTYEYKVEYRSGSNPTVAFAQGVLNVTTTTTSQTDILNLSAPSNASYPTQRITSISMPSNSDVVSWNYAKLNASDTVTFTYTVGGTQYSASINGSSPSFSAQMSALPIASNQSIPWVLTYTRAGETNPYARANGTATITITGTQTNPTVTMVSQAPVYPSGVVEISAPTDLGGDYFGWASLSPEAGATVTFKLNGVVTATETIGSGRRINFASLTPNTTYNYELTFTRSGQTNPYARAVGTFSTSKSPGGITGTSFTIAPPRAETTFDVTPSYGTMNLVWPPTATYYLYEFGQGGPRVYYGPRPYDQNGGYVEINPPSPEYPNGTWTRYDPPTYKYFANAQAITWARTGGVESTAKFSYWSLSDPTNVKTMTVGAYDTSWAAYVTDQNGNLVNLADGNYGYKLEMSRTGSGVPYGVQTGTFTRSGGAYTALTPNTNNTPVTQSVTPTTKQSFDRWGNLLSATDAASNVTNYRYNARNQLVQTLEATDRLVKYSTTSASSDTIGRAEKTNHYDLLGRLIETQDGYDQASRVTYNAAGQQISKRGADYASHAATSANVYDTFGNLIQTTDELGFKTRNKYDKMGRLIEVAREITHTSTGGGFAVQANPADTSGTLANVQRQLFVYDQLGRRVSETSGIDAEVTRYRYDHRGNVTYRMTPLQAANGVGTSYAYDLNGKLITETDAIGAVKSWVYNAFGRLSSHSELSGASNIGQATGTTVTYNYNEANQITGQTSPSGQNTAYGYDTGGNLTSIQDLALNRQTLYRYDAAGRKSRESVYIEGRRHQDTKIGYDAHNRINNLDDPDYREQIAYDANGNRSLVAVSYIDHGNRVNSDTLSYTYDEMNRVTSSSHYVTSAQYNAITTFTYNGRGERVNVLGADMDMWERKTWGSTVTYSIKENQLHVPVLEQYTYDGLGRLKTVIRDVEWVNWTSSGTLISRAYQATQIHSYTYDNANRVYTDTSSSFEGGTTAVDRVTTNLYDADGRSNTSTTTRGGFTESVTMFGRSTWNGSSWTRGYDDAGNVRGYDVEYHNPSNGNTQYTASYKSQYKLGEGYLETDQSVVRSDVPNTTNHFYKSYDVNGALIRTDDSTNANLSRNFANNQNGQALTVVNGNFVAGSLTTAWDATIMRGSYGGTSNYGKAQYFFFVDGNQIGTFGQLQKNGVFQANFDTNYTPVSDSYPASVPSTIIVQAGDTLRSIAARVFGDDSLWYILANENGLTSPDADLTDGMQLRVPNDVISLSNTSNSFKPFNPADAIGDTTPTMPDPPAPKGGCGVIGMIIMIVVMIVVTIFTAGVAAGIMGTMAGSFSGIMAAGATALTATGAASLGFVAGAVVGAVSSVVTQGIGMALGIQEKFDWKQVAVGAISGGIGGGLAKAGMTVQAGTSIGSKMWAAGANAVMTNSLTQGVSVAVGLQKKFDWRSVAQSAVAAPLAAAAGDFVAGKFGGESALKAVGYNMTKFANTATSTVVTAAVRSAMGGKFDVKQVTADIFGNAIGNAVVDSILEYHAVVTGGVEKMRAHAKKEGLAFDEKLATDLAKSQYWQSWNPKSFTADRQDDFFRRSMQVFGAGDDDVAEALKALRAARDSRNTDPDSPAGLADGQTEIVVTGRREKGIPERKMGAFGNFLNAWEDPISTVGRFGIQAGEYIEKHWWLKYGLMAVEAITSPFMFAGRKLLMATPLGTKIEEFGDRAMHAAVDYVNQEGRFGSLTRSGEMVAGLMIGGGLAVGGIALFTKLAKVAGGVVRKLFRPRHYEFNDINAFVRAANDPEPHAIYSFNGISAHTDGIGRVKLLEGQLRRNPIGRNDPLGQRASGYAGYDTDVGFHLWPDQGGAPTSRLTVVPGNGKPIGDGLPNLNNGEWASMEKRLLSIADDPNRTVMMRVEPVYNPGNGGIRPDVMRVHYNIDGNGWEATDFINKF